MQNSKGIAKRTAKKGTAKKDSRRGQESKIDKSPAIKVRKRERGKHT